MFEFINLELVVAISLIFLVLLLYFEVASPIILFGIILGFYIIIGVISTQEILNGLANEQIGVIAMLLVISGVIKKLGVLEYFFSYFFKKTKTYNSFLLKLGIITSSFSSVLNNTPIVALFMPYVEKWAKKKNISPSKLLIPLSYMAILGGTITLIGTSTNLIINSLYIEEGFESLGLFSFSIVGIPLVIVGLIYLSFAHILLPKNRDVSTQFMHDRKNYLFEFKVKSNSSMIGKSISQNGLKSLKNFYLAEIIRDGVVFDVDKNQVIRKGDVLIFIGDTKYVSQIEEKFPGIKPVSLKDDEKINSIVEVVLGANSNLINKKINQSNFRENYGGVILGIYRGSEKLQGKIGEIKLKAGDTLLVSPTSKNILSRDDFYIISNVKDLDIKPVKGVLVLFGFIFTIIFSLFTSLTLFTGLLFYLGVLLLFNITNLDNIKSTLDFNIIAIAVAALALGKAVINSGVADSFASVIINLFEPLGMIGFLIGLYLITLILTESVTNMAAASIVFPIAMSISKMLGEEPIGFILLIAFAASTSFMTPFGYQTNLMVYSSGGYRFRDFVKIGFPLTLLCMITTITIIYFYYF